MNRIQKYYHHGYDCECDGCRNCEPVTPQPIERLVAMPLEMLVAREAAMFERGRQQEIEVAQSLMAKLNAVNQERIETAYQEGKATMAGLCLVAGVCIAIAKVVLG